MTNQPLHHFYHVYSNGQWRDPFEEHLDALKRFGLIDTLATFHVGLVGAEHTRQEVKEFMRENDIVANVCAEVDEGWEQETQDKMYEFAQNNTGYVLYTHTKTAVNQIPLHFMWRRSMEYYNVVQWKDCVAKLDEGFSATGCHYLTDVGAVQMNSNIGFFGGTYWWTHMKYIAKFGLPDRNSRYDAEGWIMRLKPVVESMQENFMVFDYNPSHPAAATGMITGW